MLRGDAIRYNDEKGLKALNDAIQEQLYGQDKELQLTMRQPCTAFVTFNHVLGAKLFTKYILQSHEIKDEGPRVNDEGSYYSMSSAD